MDGQDTFTEVTNQSWGSRLVGSIKSVLIGIVLFLISFIVLWYNEGRAVKTATGLEQGASQVITVDSGELIQENSGKLVHLTGKVVTKENLTDEDFKIDVNAIKLRRNVYMYQWVEKKERKKEKKIGGGEKTTTTYRYEKRWENNVINSTNFRKPNGHTNPKSLLHAKYSHTVSNATIGKYNLSKSLLSQAGGFEPLAITTLDTLKHKNARIISEGSNSSGSSNTLTKKVYIGKGTSSSPQIGDVKVSFDIIASGNDYSIISQQNGATFNAFQTNTGTTINIISEGVLSSENMFATAQKNNTILTWILRAVGFFMMFFGLSMILKPLVILADVLPFLGSILDFGLILFVGIISFGLSFITIALAWLAYRPLLGVLLLVVGGGVIGFILFRKSKKTKIAKSVKVIENT